MEQIEKRFWSKVRKSSGCWTWTAVTIKKGYGIFSLGGKKVGAHRFAFCLANNVKLTSDQWVCHHCDTPGCVKPSHLFLGNSALNIADQIKKGRHHYQKRTHCKNGHLFCKSNLGKLKSNSTWVGRRCKECHKIKSRAYRLKKRKAA